jgi:hypothetical protein
MDLTRLRGHLVVSIQRVQDGKSKTRNDDLLRIVDRSRIAPQAVVVEGKDAIMDTCNPEGSGC